MIEKLIPLETVQAYCTRCLGMKQFNTEAIKDCQGNQATNGACPFFPYRLGKRVPVKVFRRYCLYCTNGAREDVAECPAVTCPAYPYRFGKNPALAGKRKTTQAGMDALRKVNQTRRDDVNKRPESIFSGRA